MRYLLGVDIGTSGTKTVLFSADGIPVAQASREYPLYTPASGFAEQEPEDWWNATRDTIAEVLRTSQVAPSDIAGIGLSGQMHGVVPLDESGKVLRKAIIWCDQRSAKQCAELEETIGRKRLIQITANPAITGFSASKILWLRENEPEMFAKVRHILLPKDFVRLRLTGEYASEVSDASGTQLLDVPNRCWSKELLNILGLDEKLFPPVYESCEISAHVSKEAAAETGLLCGTPVAGGAGDQAAGAVGMGIVRSGVISSTIGTSGVIFAHTDKPLIDPQGRVHTLCHAVPGTWHIMGVTQAAGLSLRWFRDNFCMPEIQASETAGVDPYVLMDREAVRIPAGAGGVLYLPYLNGERTPHLDPDCRGTFFGLDAGHTRYHMLRAVMEGVGYSLRDCFEIIRGLGVSVEEVRAAGGGAKSLLWLHMQADMFHSPVYTLQTTEAGALGVAILAGVGAGVYENVPKACAELLKSKQTILPDEAVISVYDRYYPVYQGLYASLKENWKALAAAKAVL